MAIYFIYLNAGSKDGCGTKVSGPCLIPVFMNWIPITLKIRFSVLMGSTC